MSHPFNFTQKNLLNENPEFFHGDSFKYSVCCVVYRIEVISPAKKSGASGKLSEYISSKNAVPGQGVSTAMDVRLETGLHLTPEIKLKVRGIVTICAV